MRISEKRRKWLTRKAVGRCIILSLALMALSLLLKLAELAIVSNMETIDRIILFVIVLAVLTITIWFLGFTNPDVMDVILKMLGQEEEKKED
jgi:multisubunit Na+/H+ antiporter MnhB subunit